MHYEHTQVAAPWLRVLVFILIVGVVVLALGSGEWLAAAIGLSVGAIVGAAVIVGSRLTVSVDDAAVHAAFGWGWPRRKIAHKQVTEARIVRNKAWYGFGIRWIPNGTLWNVYGLDAVELELQSGRVFRIGTDEPAALWGALMGRVKTT